MTVSTQKQKETTARGGNDNGGAYLTKHRDRRDYVLRLSFAPVLICVVSFAKAAYYRLLRPTPSQCGDFGWYSSSSGEFQCDYKPLDYHAILALMWLGTYALQTLLIATGLPSIHKVTGKVGFLIAFANAAGMLYLAIEDTIHPMPETDRPPDFTPFMFLVAVKLTICLVVSMIKIKKQNDTEGHILWMYRGFVTSFTTPVIRFYPLVLRLLAGNDCFDRNRQKFVMGAMFVSELTCSVLYSMVQRKTQKVFWDTFMKVQAVTFLAALAKDIKFASENGFFVTGMIQCWTEKASTDEL